MKLLEDSFILFKQLASLQASREVYVLFGVAKITAFVIGIFVGSYLL